MGLVNGHIICIGLCHALLVVALKVTVVDADGVIEVGEHGILVLRGGNRARGIGRGPSLVRRARSLLESLEGFCRRWVLHLFGASVAGPRPDDGGGARTPSRRAFGLGDLPDIRQHGSISVDDGRRRRHGAGDVCARRELELHVHVDSLRILPHHERRMGSVGGGRAIIIGKNHVGVRQCRRAGQRGI